jgi:hypothetical protein
MTGLSLVVEITAGRKRLKLRVTAANQGDQSSAKDGLFVIERGHYTEIDIDPDRLVDWTDTLSPAGFRSIIGMTDLDDADLGFPVSLASY